MSSFFPPDADKLKHVLPPVARIPSGKNVAVWERLLSAAAAAALVRVASRSGSGWRVLLLIAGSELMRRAVSGHSFLYSSLGISTAGHSRQHLSTSYGQQMADGFTPMPYDVKRTVTIARPRAEVFGHVHNLAHVLRDVPEIKDFQQRPDALDFTFAPPVGAACALHFDVYIVENERYVAWHCEMNGEDTAQGFLVFADAPGGRGTEVTVALWHSRSTSSSLSAALRLLVNSMDRALRKYLRAAKQVIETGHMASAQRLPVPDDILHRPPLGGTPANPQTTPFSVL
jgi:uncharacterized membrane protein